MLSNPHPFPEQTFSSGTSSNAMKIRSLYPLVLIAAIIACGHPDDAAKNTAATAQLTLQQRLDTCPTDTDRFMLLGENVERTMYDGNKDSSLYYLTLCRKEAEKTNNFNLLERAEDVRINVLMFVHDSLALDEAIALVRKRERLDRPRPLGVARELLGGYFLRTEMFTQADSLMRLAAESARIAKDTTRWTGAVLGRIMANNKLGLKDTARMLCRLALELADGSRDHDLPTSVRIELATVYNDVGRPDSSMLLLNEAFDRASARHDTLSMEQALANKSDFLAKQGFHDLAAEAQFECLALIDRFGPPDYLAPLNFELAANYAQIGRITEALERFRAAERYGRTFNMPALTSIAQAGWAATYARDKSAASAVRSALDSALLLLEGTGAVRELAQVQEHYGEVEAIAGRPDSADAHYDRAAQLYLAAQDVAGTASVQLAKGRLLANGKQPERAEHVVDQALMAARAADLRTLLATGLEQRSRLFELRGDIPSALRTLQEAHALRDSLRNDGKTRAIAEREAKYANTKRAFTDSVVHAGELRDRDLVAANARLGESDANFRTLVIGALAVLLLGTGFALYQFRQQKLLKEAAEQRLMASEARNMALRAQMQPHFINNTIGLVIARMRRKGDGGIDAAIELLAAFNTWIGRVLETSLLEKLPLRDEFDSLAAYLELQRMRLVDRLTYEVRIAESIKAETSMVPPLLLQPLIENAIKHGITPLQVPGRILLSADPAPKGLLLAVEDNGVGRATAAEQDRSDGRQRSVSMDNIREQLRIISERTGKPTDLRIIDLPQGTRVEVLLPIG